MNLHRAGDRSLQFLILNEEFRVSASHQLALNTSLPFVHTARRYYRLKGLVRCLDCASGGRKSCRGSKKPTKLNFVRGSKSHNKVSVGEPAEGSSLTWSLRDVGPESELFSTGSPIRGSASGSWFVGCHLGSCGTGEWLDWSVFLLLRSSLLPHAQLLCF